MKGNFDTIISDFKPVIIDFHALWCSPCNVQSPILKEVATELGDRVRIIVKQFGITPDIYKKFIKSVKNENGLLVKMKEILKEWKVTDNLEKILKELVG